VGVCEHGCVGDMARDSVEWGGCADRERAGAGGARREHADGWGGAGGWSGGGGGEEGCARGRGGAGWGGERGGGRTPP